MAVQETTVYNNVEVLQKAYDAYGLGPIPPGTKIDDAVTGIKASQVASLTKDWPTQFAAMPIGATPDSSIMGPWNDNVAGSAPPCAIQAISQDMQTWLLPVDTDAINDMAKQITQAISNTGGLKGEHFGRTQLASGSEQLDWGVAYVATVVSNNPELSYIVYSFIAALNVL